MNFLIFLHTKTSMNKIERIHFARICNIVRRTMSESAMKPTAEKQV